MSLPTHGINMLFVVIIQLADVDGWIEWHDKYFICMLGIIFLLSGGGVGGPLATWGWRAATREQGVQIVSRGARCQAAGYPFGEEGVSMFKLESVDSSGQYPLITEVIHHWGS